MPPGSFDIKAYGAKCDARWFQDNYIAAGSSNLLSHDARFQPADVGKAVWIVGAGPGGLPLKSTITGVTYPGAYQWVTIADAATVAASGSGAIVGTDDSAAVASALAALYVARGGEIMIPESTLTTTVTDTLPNVPITIRGAGIHVSLYGPGISRFNRVADACSGAELTVRGVTLDGTFDSVSGRALDILGCFGAYIECRIYGYRYQVVLSRSQKIIFSPMCQFTASPSTKAGIWAAYGSEGHPAYITTPGLSVNDVQVPVSFNWTQAGADSCPVVLDVGVQWDFTGFKSYGGNVHATHARIVGATASFAQTELELARTYSVQFAGTTWEANTAVPFPKSIVNFGANSYMDRPVDATHIGQLTCIGTSWIIGGSPVFLNMAGVQTLVSLGCANYGLGNGTSLYGEGQAIQSDIRADYGAPLTIRGTGVNSSAAGGIGHFGHAAPTTQPTAPTTLADVIAIVRGCGLSA